MTPEIKMERATSPIKMLRDLETPAEQRDLVKSLMTDDSFLAAVEEDELEENGLVHIMMKAKCPFPDSFASSIAGDYERTIRFARLAAGSSYNPSDDRLVSAIVDAACHGPTGRSALILFLDANPSRRMQVSDVILLANSGAPDAAAAVALRDPALYTETILEILLRAGASSAALKPINDSITAGYMTSDAYAETGWVGAWLKRNGRPAVAEELRAAVKALKGKTLIETPDASYFTASMISGPGEGRLEEALSRAMQLPDFFNNVVAGLKSPGSHLMNAFLNSYRFDGDMKKRFFDQLSDDIFMKVVTTMASSGFGLSAISYQEKFENDYYEPLVSLTENLLSRREGTISFRFSTVPRESRYFKKALLTDRKRKAGHPLAKAEDYADLVKEGHTDFVLLFIRYLKRDEELSLLPADSLGLCCRAAATPAALAREVDSHKRFGHSFAQSLIDLLHPHLSAEQRRAFGTRGLVPRKALETTGALETEPREKKSLKKTYFNEIFESLVSGKEEDFRRWIRESPAYTFQKFLEDCWSLKTRREQILKARVSSECLYWLTLDEMLELKRARLLLDFNQYGSLENTESFKAQRKPKARLKTKDDYELAQSLTHDCEFMALMVDDHLDFLRDCDDHMLDSYLQYIRKKMTALMPKVLADKKILSRIVKYYQGPDSHISTPMITVLAPLLPAEEVRERIDYSEVYQDQDLFRQVLSLRCSDGLALVDDAVFRKTAVVRTLLKPAPFMPSLIERFPDFAKGLARAFVQGEEELKKFFGEDSKFYKYGGSLRRPKETVLYYKNIYATQDLKGSKKAVDRIYKDGGRLVDFVKRLPDLAVLSEHHEGRPVLLEAVDNRGWYQQRKQNVTDSASLEAFLQKAPGVTVDLSDLNLGGIDLASIDALTRLAGRLRVRRIHLDGSRHELPLQGDLTEEESRDPYMRLLNAHGLTHFTITLNRYYGALNVFFDAVKQGFPLGEDLTRDAAAFLHDHIEADYQIEISGPESLKIMENQLGFTYTEKTVSWLIDKCHALEEVLLYVASRVPDLSFVYVKDDDLSRVERNSPKAHKALIEAGLMSLPENELKLLNIKREIVLAGKNFRPVDLEDLSDREKASLIKHIETRVDPRFKELRLTSMVLSDLKQIYPFDAMDMIYNLTDERLREVFGLPDQFLKAARLMAELRNVIRINPTIPRKAFLVKSFISQISSSAEFSKDDFITVIDSKIVRESEDFSTIDQGVVEALVSGFEENPKARAFLLKGKKKSDVMSFLRHASRQDSSQARDICQMIESSFKSLAAMRERLEGLAKDTDRSEDELREAEERLRTTVEGYEERVAAISSLDHPTDIHDRLVTIMQAFKKDPSQILGQDRFKPLEKPDATKDLGCALYFPKTRGELVDLGQRYGWCVSTHSSYGDNVIQKGNILVAICRAGEKPHIDTVEALAHFVRRGPGDYYLEQMKGPRNADVSGRYNHRAILQAILAEDEAAQGD